MSRGSLNVWAHKTNDVVVLSTMKTKTARKGQSPRKPSRTLAGTTASVAQSDVGKVSPKWRWHYRTLLTLRQQLLRESSEKLREAAEPIEGHGMHLADSATDEFEHDVALALLAREQNALSDVNDAITRILDGRYGICEATGAKIPARRLRALPWCRYSVEAEEQLERSKRHTRCRVPDAVSLRGETKDLPGTGTITRGDSEGPGEEPSERDDAKKLAALSRPKARDIEGAFRDTRSREARSEDDRGEAS